jgi:hypothetical protein
MSFKNFLLAAAVAAIALTAGCAGDNGYQKAFSSDSALVGNHHTFKAFEDQTFRTVKVTLVRQGFTIEQADPSSGLIKAVRNLQDPSDENISYNINATADVSADGDSSIVTLAASQQTVLHREWHDWWHLLWIIPLFPTGTEYQTVVTKEGNVTDIAFYNDFFANVQKALPKTVAPPPPPPVVLAPVTPVEAAPAAPADTTTAPAAPAADAAAPADPAPPSAPAPAATAPSP